MPVVFPLLKELSKRSHSWTTKLRTNTIGRFKPASHSRTNDPNALHYLEVPEEGLPQIPKGTLKGLRSFFRNYRRTRTDQLYTQTELSTTKILTGTSNSDDYHAQLREGAWQNRRPSEVST